MCPPVASRLPDIDIASTYEELFGSLEKMHRGYPLPNNVINDIDPHKYMPSNLPAGVWYLVPSKENTSASHGHWKARGEACEVFSNSVITGWRTTLEFYEGPVPHERKTDWIMQEFRITQKQCKSKKAEDASFLCVVFLIGNPSPNHEKQQKMLCPDINSKTCSQSTQLSSASANNGRSSTSKPQVNNEDDETKEMAAMERPINQLVEHLSQIDYISGGDYLELRDLDDLASPSSSSENSSCMTMSSDEYFDLTLLEELEYEINEDIVQENAGYKYSFSTSHKANEVVMFPESLIGVQRRKSPSDETSKTDSSMPGSSMLHRDVDHNAAKQIIRGQKADYRDEYPSSNFQNQITASDSNKAVPNGKRKATVGTIKNLKKKYFCFMPF